MDNVTLYLGDCLERMEELPDQSVDMVLADPPYGTTDCKWDTVIDLDAMWTALKRIVKPNGAIVMTASQPFTTALIYSNINNFRYEWIWSKNQASGFVNAKRMPMKSHENVCVFYRSQPTYNKQPTESKISDRKLGGSNGMRGNARVEVYGGLKVNNVPDTLKKNVSPRSVLEIKVVTKAKGTFHPTQKPVALMEYLIRTYTNEGEAVLDFTMGSGTTGVAAANTGRDFIGIEIDAEYVEIARQRIKAAANERDLFTEV